MHTFLIILITIILIIPSLAILFMLFLLLYCGILLCTRPLKKLYEKRRRDADFCPLDEMPHTMEELILAAEDLRFYEHKGFRTKAIKGAFMINRRAREIVTGGSTITQQLMKNLYFHFKKSYFRKAAELILSVHAERVLGKKRILEMYLNIIYFGNGIYGIVDAARFYFDKSINELSANQMFMLSCMPTAPTRGNPIQYPAVFCRIRNTMLDRLIDSKTGEALILSMEDIEKIRTYDASCLDPDLRKNDSFTSSYPQDIVLTNERFGPFKNNKNNKEVQQ